MFRTQFGTWNTDVFLNPKPGTWNLDVFWERTYAEIAQN